MHWFKFGMLLPWIGFRAVDEEDRETARLCDCCNWRAFSIEWLGMGIVWLMKDKP